MTILQSIVTFFQPGRFCLAAKKAFTEVCLHELSKAALEPQFSHTYTYTVGSRYWPSFSVCLSVCVLPLIVARRLMRSLLSLCACVSHYFFVLMWSVSRIKEAYEITFLSVCNLIFFRAYEVIFLSM
jgi:hypothetical protein